MADEAESGHIRAAVDVELEHSLTGRPVQREHGIDGRLNVSVGREPPLERGRDHARPQALGEHERIPDHCAGVRLHALGIDSAGHRIAELDFLIGDTVAAEDCAFGLAHLFRASSQDLG